MIEINLTSKKKIDLLKKGSEMLRLSSSGITLIEVLMGAVLSVFVIGGATFGVMAMMQRNSRLEARSQTRMDLDRGINYIADEIRSANDVAIVQSGSNFPGSGTGVLLLTIPDDTTNPNRVYFIRSSTPTWRGPNTINRYAGTISNPVTAIPTNGDDVLVDGLIAPNSTELTTIQAACDTNGDGTTDLKGADGFYACINETTNTVNLYFYGKLTNDPTQENLALTTRVSARIAP